MLLSRFFKIIISILEIICGEKSSVKYSYQLLRISDFKLSLPLAKETMFRPRVTS